MEAMREQPADSTTPIEFFRVPVRRMFKTKAAAQYLGLHPQTLRRLTDEGKLKARNMEGKRVYMLEELDRYIVSLPGTMAPAKGPRHPMENVMGFKKVKDVEPATVNRSLAVLKNMLGFAVDKEYLIANPLARFKLLPEEQKPTCVLTLEEYWRLIESHDDPVAAAYATVLGETAIRKAEGIRLTWSFIDIHQRLLTVERSKNRKPRYIPLSEFALQTLASLPRLDACPSVFVRLENGTPWHSFQGPFNRAKEKAGLGWVGFHDLCHFRASQWAMQGVDIRTVQELLGHQSITTTMRYYAQTPVMCSKRPNSVIARDAH